MEKCLQERVFELLCRNDAFHLKEIERQCREHLKETNQGKLVYRFIFAVDVIELIDFDVRLGNLALHNTLQLVALFQEVCYMTISILRWIPSVTSSAQVLVVLRLSSVPHLPEYHSIERRSLMNNTRIHPGTFSIDGFVCAITGVTEYTQSARFYCPISTCPGSSRCCYIRVHLAGRNEALTTGKTFNCKYCRSTLQEDATCRILSEKSVVHVISLQSLTTKTWTRHQAVSFYLRDELTKEVQLGDLYRFTLFHFLETGECSELTSSTPVFEANSIEKIKYPLVMLKKISVFPESVRLLLEDRRDSPWSFAASMAYCFGASIVHPNSFLQLKMSLLLSLVVHGTSSNSLVNRLDILALGQDSLPIERLMVYAASFAPRKVIYSTSSDLFASVSRDPSGTGTFLINAGSLLLANDGICIIPNVNTLKNDSKERLRRVLETRLEAVEVPKKYTEYPQHLSIPVKSSVWAFNDSQNMAMKSSVESWDDSTPNLGATTKALINRFSLVVNVLKDNKDDDNTTDLTLMRAMEDYDEERLYFIPEQEMKQFLEIASTKTVTFADSPQKLIQSFYLAGRRARNMQGDFPLASLQTITSLAAAHAKLSLRDQVTDEDVVVAVQLFDSSLKTSHGYSLLGLKHDCLDAESILSVQYDLKMRELQKMLYSFCSNHNFNSTFLMDSLVDHED